MVRVLLIVALLSIDWYFDTGTGPYQSSHATVASAAFAGADSNEERAPVALTNGFESGPICSIRGRNVALISHRHESILERIANPLSIDLPAHGMSLTPSSLRVTPLLL